MITNEMRTKIDKECVQWYQALQEIKKDEKSEHQYRFQNFVLSDRWPVVWLDVKQVKSIYPSDYVMKYKQIPL